MDYLKAGLLVGALGDIALQLADKWGVGNAGLHTYFQGSRLANVVSASLLTGAWSGAGEVVVGRGWPFLVWVACVDVLYRRFHATLYPSLAQYYAQNSPLATVGYNVVAGAMVMGAARFLEVWLV
jgi:hypothetical protein